MMANTILVTREGAIAVVQLNRPQVLNALNEEVLTELGAAMRELDDDPTCRCIVLTGNEKAFAA
ncbi:MAG: enoyl-CoA hydratase-related protein, partial [Chloroflexota bacterium]